MNGKNRIMGLGLGLIAACATTSVRGQKTADFREASYRTIGPGAEAPVDEFERQPLPDEREKRAWAIMKAQLVPKRWEFADPTGTDLLVRFGVGRAEGDRGERIGADTLVVDVFERETGERVWFGYAPEATPLEEGDLNRVLSQMLLSFPEIPPRPAAY